MVHQSVYPRNDRGVSPQIVDRARTAVAIVECLDFSLEINVLAFQRAYGAYLCHRECEELYSIVGLLVVKWRWVDGRAGLCEVLLASGSISKSGEI